MSVFITHLMVFSEAWILNLENEKLGPVCKRKNLKLERSGNGERLFEVCKTWSFSLGFFITFFSLGYKEDHKVWSLFKKYSRHIFHLVSQYLDVMSVGNMDSHIGSLSEGLSWSRTGDARTSGDKSQTPLTSLLTR